MTPLCPNRADLWQDERRPAIENIVERGQTRPADWPKTFPSQKFEDKQIATARADWTWIKLATVEDLTPTEHNTTCVCLPPVVPESS